MDAFVKLARSDNGQTGDVSLDTAANGLTFLFNRQGHLWRADGRLLHLEKSAYYDAHCYELRCKWERSWESITCESVHAHADAGFVLVHATQVRCYDVHLRQFRSETEFESRNKASAVYVSRSAGTGASTLCCWWIQILPFQRTSRSHSGFAWAKTRNHTS